MSVREGFDLSEFVIDTETRYVPFVGRQSQTGRDRRPQTAAAAPARGPIATKLQFITQIIPRLFNRNTLAELKVALTWIGISVVIVLFMYMSVKGRKRQYQVSVTALLQNPEEYPLMVWHTPAPWRFGRPEQALMCSEGRKTFYCATTSNRTFGAPEAYLFYGPYINFSDLPLPRLRHLIWGLLTDETPKNKLELLHEKTLNLFNFSSTFSRFSDQPIPLTWMMTDLDTFRNKYLWMPTKQKNRILGNYAAVVYIQSTCGVSTERDNYVTELMKYIKIDSVGRCINNIRMWINYPISSDEEDDLMTRLYELDALRYFGKYKFMIILDGEVCSDFVPEKVWRALRLGIVPIFFGSPTIRDWLPNPKSAVLLEDFPTPKLLADHLTMLLHNDTAYEEYLVHKTKGFISNKRLYAECALRPYQTSFMSAVKNFECFVCEKLHLTRNDTLHQPINMMTKKQYNCSQSITALSLNTTLNLTKLAAIEKAKNIVDDIYNFSLSVQKQ